MKNNTMCENCYSENDYFNLSCSTCGSLLRDKTPNVDLFSTIWQLIESPTKAIKRIVFSEHKNYLTFLLLLLVTKFVFSSFFIQSILIEPVNYQKYLSANFGIGFAIILFLILVFPFIQTKILKSKNVNTRYKDNLAIVVYTQMPVILFLLLILPIEFALFGKFWLFSNPSPFIIKVNSSLFIFNYGKYWY